MKTNSDDDNELRKLAKELTHEELLMLAKELERQAEFIRRLSCDEVSGQQIVLGHVRWTLSFQEPPDPSAN